MLVKDVMTKNPVTVQSDVSVLEAKELFTKNKISKLPVLNKNGELVVIITKNDLNRASPSDASTLDVYEMGYLLSKITVEKTMCKSVKTTTEDIPVEEAARLMADYGIGCLPVVSGKLVVGIVTSSDLFHCFVEMFSTKNPGVRASLEMSEHPGSLAAFAAEVAKINGNIVSIVTADSDKNERRNVTVKVSGITIEDFKKVIEGKDIIVTDIRNV